MAPQQVIYLEASVLLWPFSNGTQIESVAVDWFQSVLSSTVSVRSALRQLEQITS